MEEKLSEILSDIATIRENLKEMDKRVKKIEEAIEKLRLVIGE